MTNSPTHPLFDQLESRYPDLAVCLPQVKATAALLLNTVQHGGKLLLCGNGGSAADCDHIVGELMKGFRLPRPLSPADQKCLREIEGGNELAVRLQGAIPAISLVSQSALITAIANDTAANMIFAQQVYGYGRPGDVLIAISTSGNAVSVLNAARVARAFGIAVVGLTGRTGGALLPLCDVAICVPYDTTAEVQERHLPVYHTLCSWLEEMMFGMTNGQES